jgi:hypothetical protein
MRAHRHVAGWHEGDATMPVTTLRSKAGGCCESHANHNALADIAFGGAVAISAP